jgi:hypothetical protein
MRKWLFLILIFASACGGRQRNYQAAENALDAGREFIDACLKGDFSRAGFFMLPGPANEQKLKDLERDYREKDKEGRQQYRTASININEVKELTADTTVIRYSNTVDRVTEIMRVIRKEQGWLVDLATKDTTAH